MARKQGYLNSGATISTNGLYRYHLWRIWEDHLPIMVFVMCNPSTADADTDDPTIRRCMSFARRECFGGISVRNVFALRATDPRELLKHPDPFGPDNAEALANARGISPLTQLVVAWGSRIGGKRLRDYYCRAACACVSQKAYCFGTTKPGDPRHPLYLPSNAELVPWKMPEM